MRGGEKVKDPGKLFKRVWNYMMAGYKWYFVIVVICIILSGVATIIGTLFMRTLVDDYIVPLTKMADPDYGPLAQAVLKMVGVFLIGVFSSWLYNRLMINVTQGSLRRLRVDLFHKMEYLPIKYFDTHSHGDIMSVYTNDVDTMRQLISQSVPQIINSTITFLMTFVSMIAGFSDSATPWTSARQASLSITNSWSLLKPMSIKLVNDGANYQARAF